MADSITAMGSSPKYFPLQPNWANPPTSNFGLAREYVSFPGTTQLIGSTTELAPKEFTLSFLVDNKNDEFDLLEFLHDVKGKAYRFWIEHPATAFVLKETASSGSSSIKCIRNGFEKISQQNERMFVPFKNGDLLVRKMTEANWDSATEELTLVLDSPVDRDLTLTNHWFIGRFLLCRLADDKFKMEHVTRDVSRFTLKFSELPDEYDDEEAS